jgi:hypothetical protein
VSCAGGISRRALLAGAGIGLLGGAGLLGCTPVKQQQLPDPDAAALAAARGMELALLANYAVGDPSYRVHLAHLHALGGRPPSPADSSGPVSPRVAAAAEATSVPALQAAAIAAVRGPNAALLASIAASHAALDHR